MSDSIVDTLKNTTDDILEIAKERLFSPMYFYFIIAWVITNWKFVYVFLFADEEFLKIPKLDYLVSLYPCYTWQNILWNSMVLFIIPAISAYIAVWWMSRISEKFYERYEQFKINQFVIRRKLDYTAKVQEANEKREIREIEADKKNTDFEDNPDFNDYIDEWSNDVEVMGIRIRPSEVLYNNDYPAYKQELLVWQENLSTFITFPNMQHTPVSSTNIRSIWYDSASQTLEVEFLSNWVYQYLWVPEWVYLAFLSASSKGAYFSQNIKDTYKYAKK